MNYLTHKRHLTLKYFDTYLYIEILMSIIFNSCVFAILDSNGCTNKQLVKYLEIDILFYSYSLGYLRNAHTTNNNENENKNEYIYDSAPIFPFFLLSHLLCLIHCWSWYCSCILLLKRRANHLVRNHSISRLVYAH